MDFRALSKNSERVLSAIKQGDKVNGQATVITRIGSIFDGHLCKCRMHRTQAKESKLYLRGSKFTDWSHETDEVIFSILGKDLLSKKFSAQKVEARLKVMLYNQFMNLSNSDNI